MANDPDFALRRVRLSAVAGSRTLVDQSLLDEAWRGQFQRTFHFDANQHSLHPGDVVEYWAVAEDNKDPHPNRTETIKRRIKIIAPSRQPVRDDQLAKKNDDAAGDKGQESGNRPGDGDHPRIKTQPRNNRSSIPTAS